MQYQTAENDEPVEFFLEVVKCRVHQRLHQLVSGYVARLSCTKDARLCRADDVGRIYHVV